MGRSLDNEKDSRDITPISSFLSGRAVDPDGHPRRGEGQKTKGLAELAGREELFVELHAVFVRLLVKLSRGSTPTGGLSSSGSSVIGVEGGSGLTPTLLPAPADEEVRKDDEQPHRATSKLTLEEQNVALRGGSGRRRSACKKQGETQTEEISPKSRPAKPQSPSPKSRRGSPSQSGKQGMEGLKGRLVAV